MGQLPATGLLATLGAELPLVVAPMAGGPSTPDLVVAAARAGALGFLAAGYRTVEEMARQVTEVAAAVHLFGVNVFVPNTVRATSQEVDDYARALAPLARRLGVELGPALEDDDDWDGKVGWLCAHPVPVVSFTFGLPSAQVLASLRAVGTTVVQTVTTPAEAVQAAQLGVDALVVQSISAGGHSGTFTPQAPASDVPRADLVDDVASAVALPIWAAGGIATSDHVDEVLRTRAEAAVVGTVLLRCVESGASPAYRKALRQWTDRQTVRTTAFSGRPARALRNAFTEQFGPLAPLGYPAVHHLTSPLRRAAAAANDAEHINVWAGTGHRHGTDEPAAVILRRLAGAPPA